VVATASIADGSSRRWVHATINLLAAAALVEMAVRNGASLSEQGLSKQSMWRGLKLGALASIPVAVAIVSGSRILGLRDLYRLQTAGPIPFRAVLGEAVLRIPFVTALPEELIFRAGLLELARRRMGTNEAAAATSLLFGLFHIPPTLRRIRAGNTVRQQAAIPVWARLLANVAVTFLAGMAMTGLRLKTNSVVAPWLVHSTANASGLFTAWITSGRMSDDSCPPLRAD
jgi:CAAX protease family protein